MLTDEQKAFHKQLCEDNLAPMRINPGEFLAKVITTDETWIATFEPETKRQSAAWILPDEGVPWKACRQRGQRKTMMTVFLTFKALSTLSSCPKVVPSGGKITVKPSCA